MKCSRCEREQARFYYVEGNVYYMICELCYQALKGEVAQTS